MSALEKYNINESNCNGVLSRLYSERDRISRTIDKVIVYSGGTYPEDLDKEYQDICDEISEICNYRSTHDCLLEGDPGFSYC